MAAKSVTQQQVNPLNYLNEDTPISHAFDVVGAADIVPPKWIIKGVLPIGLTMFFAPPKNFKSTVLAHWIAKILGKESTLLPEHLSQVVKPGPVITIATESQSGVLKFDMLFGLGVHILESDPLYNQSDPWAFRLDNPMNMKELFYWMDRIQPSLVVFDPLRNSHSADENDAGEMVAIAQPFQQFCIKREIAGMFVHHTKKADKKDKVEDILRADNARGTGSITGLCDGILSQVVLDNTLDLPQLRIAGTLKRGKPFQEDIDLNVEWAKLELETDIAANVYNIVLHIPSTSEEIATKLEIKESEVLKYVNYMYKKKIIERRGKKWGIET